MFIGRTRNQITWGITILLALAFVVAGFLKVSGDESMVEAFIAYGLPAWFRISIGLIEIVGGILLVIPTFTSMSSFGLSIIMIGAVGCHLMVDPFIEAIPAALFFLGLTYIYMTRKNLVPVFLQKYLIA